MSGRSRSLTVIKPMDSSSGARRHDLDALRAAAMLLGIVYHVALSFALGQPWLVEDVSRTQGVFVFQSWVHGFRMPLFMLVSGFFTAMLWRKKGLKALLWHRCRRILIPCLLGLFTIVPAMHWASGFAMNRQAAERQAAARQEPASASLWAGIRAGEAGAVASHLEAGAGLGERHPVHGSLPLEWAALHGQAGVVTQLLDRGADVNARGRDGFTALHGAAFFGHAEVVDVLIGRGADIHAVGPTGDTPMRSAEQDFGVVRFIGGVLGVPVEEPTWRAGVTRVQERLRSLGATATAGAGAGRAEGGLRAVWSALVNTPVFVLIWFLWFLVWLVGMFALYAVVAEKAGWNPGAAAGLRSPGCLLWLVPLTAIPAWFMQTEFGPDTSMGVLPMPHVLAYYAIFFFFGAFYYDSGDLDGRLGGGWRWSLPVTVLVIFPLALECATGVFGVREGWLAPAWWKPLSVVLQTVFAWAMSFGCIGLFRSQLTRENRIVRYLSDSSYWLYLAHLPLVIVAQSLISRWPSPAWFKLGLLSLATAAVLLLSYEYLVRYTWIGALLNGRRRRTGMPPATPGREPAASG